MTHRFSAKFWYLLVALLWVSVSPELSAQTFVPGEHLMSKLISDTTFQISKNIKETHIRYLNKEGDPMAVYILEARLKRNRLSMEATSPFNKDTFARQTVRQQMKWENDPDHQVLVGVNADFFNMKTGVPTTISIKEGKILRDTIWGSRKFVGVTKRGTLLMGDSVRYEKKKNQLQEALGGYPLLVKNGRIIPQSSNSFSTTRHPRTALGIINKRKVVFVVVDGRQPKYSNGMPLDELAILMRSLGARTALNLDGGGSSTLVSKEADSDQWTVRNRPSGGRQRPVANAWILVKER